ncbi:MAG: ABC transporter substrate-binding protein [Deferrisomatales bacterium]|nr:ABC transporter substrate-binding protein [Deferrisomatales bacterium]
MIRQRSALLLVLSMAVAVAVVAHASQTPTDQVRVTVDGVIEILKDKGLDPSIRREKITTAIRERFDFEAMAQGTLAQNWKKAAPEERARFVGLFSQLLENTYMGRIEAYTDEKVRYEKEQVEDKRAVVGTVIVTNVDIPVDYKLRRKGDEWFVYDVVIEGVSLVRNYRSSYGEIVHQEGMEGLLSKMEAKVGELKTAGETGKIR